MPGHAFLVSPHNVALLEAYKHVILEAWRRQNITNAEVAAFIGRGTSLVSKIRNGRAPICSKIANLLIELFALDRARLFLAIEIAGNGDLYFDPSFKNASHAAVVFLQDLVTTLDADEDADRRAIFAAFSKPTIERVAREAGHSVVEQFSVHLHSPARQQAAG